MNYLCVFLFNEYILCLSSVSSAERQQVLGALERLQAKLVQREEWTHSETMGNLRETLQSPLFNHILTLQHSIKQLRNQVRNKKQPAAQKPEPKQQELSLRQKCVVKVCVKSNQRFVSEHVIHVRK